MEEKLVRWATLISVCLLLLTQPCPVLYPCLTVALSCTYSLSFTLDFSASGSFRPHRRAVPLVRLCSWLAPTQMRLLAPKRCSVVAFAWRSVCRRSLSRTAQRSR